MNVETTKDFWTFVISGVRSEGASAVVRGRFIVCRLRSETDPEIRAQYGDQRFEFSYLTVDEKPVEFDVSVLVPAGTRLDDLSPRLIASALRSVFQLPYRDIPPAPLSLPVQRLPPSQRDKAVAVARAARESAFDQPFFRRTEP